jgi:hypothetical protein
MNTIGITIQSYAKTTKETEWPFETFPYFQTVATQIRTVTETRLMALAPLVVSDETRVAWENYSIAHQYWIQESYKESGWPSVQQPLPIPGLVYDINEAGQTVQATGEVMLPLWQLADPPKDSSILNYNLLSSDPIRRSFTYAAASSTAQLTQIVDVSRVLGGEPQEHPESLFIQPIFGRGNTSVDGQVVAAVVTALPWDNFMSNLFHSSDANAAMVGVVNNSCGQTFTYQLNGATALYLGEGDLHNAFFDNLVYYVPMTPATPFANGTCQYVIAIYPSSQLETSSTSNGPLVFTLVMVLLFISAAFCFWTRAFYLQKRQQETMHEAARSNAIVSSLFPDEIRERLFRGDDGEANENGDGEWKESNSGNDNNKNEKSVHEAQKFRLKTFLDENGGPDDNGKLGATTNKGSIVESKPIADLFVNTTVLFADIAGFTAWSSVREPSQVFTLLETVYKAFDKTAKRRRVFKVETVGDCYVSLSIYFLVS